MSTAPYKVIGDLDFIPMSFAVTRNGRAEPLYPSEHQILALLQQGPATMDECLQASGCANKNSMSHIIAGLRKKLKPLGVTVVTAKRLRGHYALARVRP